MKKKSIIEARKEFKRNKILHIVKKEKNVSKTYLQEKTSYSISTIISIVEELIAEGYIYEEESAENKVGRRPVWLKINPDNAYSIGIEFNGDYMHCALINMIGTVIFSLSNAVDRYAEASVIVEQILKNISACIAEIEEQKEKIFGIGIGVPGYFDEGTGVGLNYSTIPSWKNIAIVNIIEETFAVPCYIENNVNAMAYAYKWSENTRMPDNFLFVSIRTGVRIVPIINQKLVLAQSGRSGQLGHTRTNRGNRICHCGKTGCLNTEVTEAGLIRSIIGGYITGGQYENFMKKQDYNFAGFGLNEIIDASESDTEIKNLMLSCAKTVGEALGSMVDIFAPTEIQLSGRIFDCGDFFFKEIDKAITNNSIAFNNKNLDIKSSKFSTNIGAIGAAAMVMEEVFESIDKDV